MKQSSKQKLANTQGLSLAEIAKVVLALPNDDLAELREKIQKELEGNSPIPEGKYLTVEEVGEYLKVCRTTVWRYSKMGILKPRKVGNRVLFARAEIDSYIQNGMSHE